MDWSLILGIVSLAFNVLLAVGMAYIAMKQGEIRDLKADLQRSTAQQIDDRFAGIFERCTLRHASLDKRLESGDRHFQESRSAEAEIMKAIAEIREQMATREDLTKLWDELRNGSNN
jgi:hypothetical protein